MTETTMAAEIAAEILDSDAGRGLPITRGGELADALAAEGCGDEWLLRQVRGLRSWVEYQTYDQSATGAYRFRPREALCLIADRPLPDRRCRIGAVEGPFHPPAEIIDQFGNTVRLRSKAAARKLPPYWVVRYLNGTILSDVHFASRAAADAFWGELPDAI